VDGLWATNSEYVWLIVVQLVSKTSNLCDPYPPTSHKKQTDRRSWRTTYNLNSQYHALQVHHAVIIMPHWVTD